MSSRNASAGAPGPAKGAPGWPSHLRQFSKSSAEEQPHLYANPHSPDTTTSSSSTIRERPQSAKRPERRWTVTVNEALSGDEVLLNLELIGDDIKPGSLVSVDVLKLETEKQHHPDRNKDGGLVGCKPKRYICIAKDLNKDFKARYHMVEVYVAKHIAEAFGMRKGTQVTVTPIDTSNPAAEASHLELCFKDQYLSRADMWRMAVGMLSERTVYKGQMILFMGTVKAQVTTVYVDGRQVHSAFFGRDTKPIFRSESARYVLFIQMSREMWDFDSDGSGEIMFNKVVNGFLPALFKKWAAMKLKHLVTIVLFARVEYDTGISIELTNAAVQNRYYTGVQSSGDRRPYKDFYRVVVSEMGSGEWTKILHQLKREFNYFRKDISTHHMKAVTWSPFPASDDPVTRESTLNRIKAEASRAVHGNFLEAINMASSLYAHDYIDRDLTRTGVSVVVISPSPGVFEVDYDALRRTTESLVGNGIGIDLICIPKIPLHSVPLFRYRAPQNSELTRHKSKLNNSSGSTPKQTGSVFGSYSSLAGSFSPGKGIEMARRGEPAGVRSAQDDYVSAVPQWLHVSYWTGASEEALSYQGIALSVSDAPHGEAGDEFPIRCRMYDLQMRSVMETNEIETKPLLMDPHFPLSALQATQISQPHIDSDGMIFVKNTKVPETIFEHAYGFQKFALDRNSKHAERSLWKQLQQYDDFRARLPASRRVTAHSRHGRIQEDAPRKQASEDPNLLSTYYSDRLPSTAIQATIPGLSQFHRHSSDRLEVPSVSSANCKSPGSSSASNTTLSPTKAPKFIRQISRSRGGFNIAAPKAAVAELSVQSVEASKSTGPHDQRMGNARADQRPMSSEKMRMGSPLFNQGSFSSHSYAQGHMSPGEPGSKPILIRNQQPTGVSMANSILASALRPEPIRHDRDIQKSNAIRIDDANRLTKSKLLADAMPELPTTLSPATALNPWLTILNPSNPRPDDVNMTSLYSRWQHVFPRPAEMRVMKWKSLCSPAAVPLTSEYFPTKTQFESEYQRQPYNVSQNLDDELSEEPRSRDDLLRELISLRFCQGFQIIVGPAVAKAFGQKQLKVADIFSRDHMMEDGTSIFMSVGNTIHQLSCANGTEVEVNIFVRKPTESSAQVYDGSSSLYKPAIRTLLDQRYRTSEFDLVTPKSERNWNYIDAFVAGHNDELTEHLRFWRARFVLIPITGRHASLPRAQSGDSDEEIRIEGIRKLAQLWQRYRYIPPNERRFQGPGARKKREVNPLDIVYKTEDPSVVIAAELETLPLLEGLDRKGQLVRSREQFSKKNFSLAALAEAIQQPVENGGVRMQNRRWHLRLHYNCFIGSDMTSWLLDNFEDLGDREEAEALGNRLMVSDDKEKDKEGGKKESGGLFVHVEKRHSFRDGQYFYQISSEYAKPQPGWFKRTQQFSIPSTPMSENMPRDLRVGISRPTSIHEEHSPTSGATTPIAPPTTIGGKKPKVILSKSIKYDVDHRKRSYRPEIVELHYDRLHNPDNCYHIRVDWMNVTAKLIEDAIENWAREAAQYGLRLVEVPIAEACSISEINPFRRPYIMKLALPPPNQSPVTYYDPNSFTPSAQPGKHFYQKAILRKFDFVLDMEAASNFPSNVDVSYSWGKPDFQYTQYIHRSGSVLAQITDEGDLLLLANRLYSSRAAAAREREMQRELRTEHPTLGGSAVATPGVGVPGGGPRSMTPLGGYPQFNLPTSIPSSSEPATSSPSIKPGFLSPITRPVGAGPGATATTVMSNPPSAGGGGGCAFGTPGILQGGAGKPPAWTWTAQEPEMIKDELEEFCGDAGALEQFYKEQRMAAAVQQAGGGVSASGIGVVGAGTGAGEAVVAEGNIPVIGLPPTIVGSVGTQQGGEGGGGGGQVPMGISPRVGSPAFMIQAGERFLRRGSVQMAGGMLEGFRMTGEPLKGIPVEGELLDNGSVQLNSAQQDVSM
ncbi:putative vacuolar membrane-associated protein IML1 [Triangularia setosa]|uniref:Vacuolar membrane-associated protein IML1 n=1 Tax=Triangularia setosa TaxID=2587417 RepID=A0AAN6WDM6_9PEZI|nr:putative vacuolar membrane-associated protein IML1 [Podospora setosa]